MMVSSGEFSGDIVHGGRCPFPLHSALAPAGSASPTGQGKCVSLVLSFFHLLIQVPQVAGWVLSGINKHRQTVRVPLRTASGHFSKKQTV